MDKRIKHISYFITAAFLLLSAGCSHKNNKESVVLTASISPVKYIVETITCGDFPVEVMVPAGASPESYSPTANQMVDMERSELIFTTGLLDFEQELASKISGKPERIINLSKNISLLDGTCAHLEENSANQKADYSHSHGIDPHIWTSPKQLKIIAANVYDAVSRQFPDSVKYKSAYEQLINDLDGLSESINEKISVSGIKYFIIYHPAMTYFANDYGLIQLSLEDEGKEPSAQHMREMVDLARSNELKFILYQKEFSRSVIEAISKEIGAEPVEIDPLKENITEEIVRITDIITEQK